MYETDFYKKWVNTSKELEECYLMIRDDKSRHKNRQLKKNTIENVRHYLNHNIAVLQSIKMIVDKK